MFEGHEDCLVLRDNTPVAAVAFSCKIYKIRLDGGNLMCLKQQHRESMHRVASDISAYQAVSADVKALLQHAVLFTPPLNGMFAACSKRQDLETV